MQKQLWILASLFLFFGSCKKEQTEWNTNWNTPLVHGRLTINDLVPTENVTENANQYASLIFNDTLFTFDLDTLIKLPDTLMTEKSAISVSSLTLSPGSTISSNDIDQNYDLGDIQLKRLIVKEGTAHLTLKSPYPGKTKMELSLPEVYDANGNAFSRTYYLDAGTNDNPTTVTESIDLTDFDFNLTGASGNLYNYFYVDLNVSSNEETNSFTIDNQDSLVFSFELTGLSPKYAKGYFGEYEVSDVAGFSIPEMKLIQANLIDLDSIDLNFSIENSFKLLAQAQLNQLSSYNSTNQSTLDLNFSQLNQMININGATGGLYDYVASIYNMALNSTNSNVLDVIETLPDSLFLDYYIHVNPYGNTTAGDDEYFPDSKLLVKAQGEFPLKFTLDQLSFKDTIDVNVNQNESARVDEGQITITYSNRFPLSLSAKMEFLNSNNEVIETLESAENVESGVYSTSTLTTQATEGELYFNLSSTAIQHVEEAERAVIHLSFSTYNGSQVTIQLDDYLDFNLFSDFGLNVKF